ncbi:MAG TPA: ATP-binding cassette domain-containing protein [Azospirillum sp.]|nr:ATP-binding cassette domain-containing protein [Azospirillum sp.]
MNTPKNTTPSVVEPPVIELIDVSHRFGTHVAVDHLNVSVAAGEMVALVGRTGAGKSTVMNMIMGSLTPSEGVVRVAGHDLSRDRRAIRRKLAVSFQTDRLLPWRTALGNVELGMEIVGIEAGERRRKALDWLDRVKMAGAASRYPHELSGGMRQRVSLARALAVDPEIILLDESFSQLDHVTSKVLRADVSALVRSLGKTLLFVTHRIDEAIEMADRIICLSAPAHVALEVRPTPAQRADSRECERLHAQIARAMGGEDITDEALAAANVTLLDRARKAQ